MVARTLWFWLCAGWLMTWLSEAYVQPVTSSICDLPPCKCTRGKLICDCSTSKMKDVTLKAELLDRYSFSSISVANCGHLHVMSRALTRLPALQQVSVTDIARLTLEEQSFSWTTEDYHHSGLLVNISGCNIPEIPSYCFRGALRDILLTSVNVSYVRSFAFSTINRADKIDFTRVSFGVIETQSFKRFGVDFLTISDSSVKLLPTRAILDVQVHQEVRLSNVKVDAIETAAFNILDPSNFRIVQSTVGHVGRWAFLVHAKGDVSIHDNYFGSVDEDAFVGFTVDKRYLQLAGKQDMVFENNTLGTFERASLTFNTTGFDPRLDWIKINQSCTCAKADSLATDLVFFSSDSNSKSPSPGVSAVIFCLNPKPTSVKDYQALDCGVIGSSLLLKAIVIATVVLVLLVIGVTVYCCFKKKGKRYINVPTSPSALKPANNHKAQMLVVPDGRTYRETELHVIVENAEPIINTEYVKDS